MINFEDAIIEINRIFNQVNIEDIYESEYGITALSFMTAFNKVNGVKLFHGATKGVIDPLDKNYVFKIGFTTRESFESPYEVNEESIYFRRELSLDYCKNEAEIFKQIKENRLEFYFASTLYLATIKDVTIYVQEKAVSFYDEGSPSHHTTAEYEHAYGVQDNFDSAEQLPADWLADFSSMYGQDELIRLCNFLDEYDVNDLHEGNVGYIGKNPIIFDYAGWYE